MSINGRRRRTTVNVEAPEVQSIDDDFYDCMTSFLRGLKIDDKSDYTITYYRTQLTRFMYTLEDMRLKTNLRAITREIIEDEYVRYLAEERRLKHASIASALRALRAFFNWAKGRGIVDKSPTTKIGLNEAIVLQQIHFLSTISDNEVDGRKWVYNSYDDWQKQFPFWSKPTIVRIFKRLKDADLIITGNYNKRSYDRTIWYAVNYKTLSKLSN